MVETIESLDFELEIGPGHDREYPVSVLESPAGQAQETMHFPFSQQLLESQLENLQVALLRSAEPRREQQSEQEGAAQDFGRALFDALFTGEVGILYDSSRRQAAEQGKVLRLKLRIAPPELAVLPWEFLYDLQLGEYVCLSHATPMVRYVAQPQAAQPSKVTPPLRILGMVATARESTRADLEREKQRLEEATQHLQSLELVAIQWVEGGTWSDLLQALESEEWHVVHFVGEGGLDASGEGYVVLADDEGQGYRLSAARLSQHLASSASLQFVSLSSTEGEGREERDQFSSTATHLVEQGIPSVLTMKLGMTKRATEAFAEALYAALAASMPIDLAVTKGRMAIWSEVTGTLEWSTPVLYTRSPGLRPFDRETLATTARQRGDEALAGDDFERAILQYTLAAEVGADPSAREKTELAKEAHQTLRGVQDALSTRADSAEARADAAIKCFNDLKSLEQRLPGSQAIHQLLLQVEEEQSTLRDQLWQDGQQLMRRKAVGLTLAGQRRRMEESVRLLKKAAVLDREESTALGEDLARATHRLGYLQSAQTRAAADRGRRLGVYGIIAVAAIGVLLVLYLVLKLLPTPAPVAESTPSDVAKPTVTATHSAVSIPAETVTAARSHTPRPMPTPTQIAMVAPTDSATPTTGVTVSPSPTHTGTPAPTSSPTREPSASPTWTATPAQSPTEALAAGTEPATATPPPPTSLPSETPTPGIVYPAPILLQPEDIVFLSQGTDTKYVMHWEWEGTLQADEWFDVRIWQTGMPHHGVAWTKQPQYVYDICLKGNGQYYWSIAVVRGEGSVWLSDLSPEAAPRRFSSSRSDQWCARHGRFLQGIEQ